MGQAQSQDAVAATSQTVRPALLEIDTLDYLKRAESRLWRDPSQHVYEDTGKRDDSPTESFSINESDRSYLKQANEEIQLPDRARSMTIEEALKELPDLLDERWVAPLVASMDTSDVTVQRAALGLLPKVLVTVSSQLIFSDVGGLSKLVDLIGTETDAICILAIDVLLAMLTLHIPASIVEELCGLNVMSKLTKLLSSDREDLVIKALQIFQLLSHEQIARERLGRADTLASIISLSDDKTPKIARESIIALGCALPNAENLRQVVEAGCIHSLLRDLEPFNANADVIIFTLSVIADQSGADAHFDVDETCQKLNAILETLRGGTKRSPIARSTCYFIASLSQSTRFHVQVCTPFTIATLSSFLTTGAADVISASIYAIGMIAMNANNSDIALSLFAGDLSSHLLYLLQSPQDTINRLCIFALANMLDGTIILPSGCSVKAEPLVVSLDLTNAIKDVVTKVVDDSTAVDVLFKYVLKANAVGAGFATVLLASLSSQVPIQKQCCTDKYVSCFITCMPNAAGRLLTSCFQFLLEMTSSSLSFKANATVSARDKSYLISVHTSVSDIISAKLHFVNDCTTLIESHTASQLIGLPLLLKQFVFSSMVFKEHATNRVLLDKVVTMATKLGNNTLHRHVLLFLDELTNQKNKRARQILFEQNPERVANFLYSSDVQVQMLAARVLRRVFKVNNDTTVPCDATFRQLVRLTGDANVDVALCVAACRVWKNLLLHTDKQETMAKTENALYNAFSLLKRCIAVQSEVSSSANVRNLVHVLETLQRAATNELCRIKCVQVPHWVCIHAMFSCNDHRVARLAVNVVQALAQTPSIRVQLCLSPILQATESLLTTTETQRAIASNVEALKLVKLLCLNNPSTQQLHLDYGIATSLVKLLESRLVTLDKGVLIGVLDAIASLCSKRTSPVTKVIGTREVMDLINSHLTSSSTGVIEAASCVLKNISHENGVQVVMEQSNTAAVIIKALELKSTAYIAQYLCAAIRHLVHDHDRIRSQFQAVDGIDALIQTAVEPIAGASAIDMLRVQKKSLQALNAICTGDSEAAMSSKEKVLTCACSSKLLYLVHTESDVEVCAAWCQAMGSSAEHCASNQSQLLGVHGVCKLLVSFGEKSEAVNLQMYAMRLLSILATKPTNSRWIMETSSQGIVDAVTVAMSGSSSETQHYAVSVLIHLAASGDEARSKIGVMGVLEPLSDLLESPTPRVVLSVLMAFAELGKFLGNKVIIGTTRNFERLLALLVHADDSVRKLAIHCIDALVQANETNCLHLTQIRTVAVLPMFCRLLEDSNADIVESAMIVLGELGVHADEGQLLSESINIRLVIQLMHSTRASVRCAALKALLHVITSSPLLFNFHIDDGLEALAQCINSDDLQAVKLAVSCTAALSESVGRIEKISQQGLFRLLVSMLEDTLAANSYGAWRKLREECELSKESTKEEINMDASLYNHTRTKVLEQSLLTIQHCAEQLRHDWVISEHNVILICNCLAGSASDIVHSCACYILACWCKGDQNLLSVATEHGVISATIQLLSMRDKSIVESALYCLSKLCPYPDNVTEMLELDILAILQNILRECLAVLNLPGVLDRCLRLLGNLASVAKVRQALRSEELVADILTSILENCPLVSKNCSRLVLTLLQEESLKFFMPKKTVRALRSVLIDEECPPKATRNILKIYIHLVSVEEHKTTIALEDDGKSVAVFISQLDLDLDLDPISIQQNINQGPLPENAIAVLQILASVSCKPKVASLLHQHRIYHLLARYLICVTFTSDLKLQDIKEEIPRGDELLMQTNTIERSNVNALVIAKDICQAIGDEAVETCSRLDYSQLLLHVLRSRMSHKAIDQITTECLQVLGILSRMNHDMNIFFVESAHDIVYFYLDLALEQSSSLLKDPESDTSKSSQLLRRYTMPSLVTVVLAMATHVDCRLNCIEKDGVRIVLSAAGALISEASLAEVLLDACVLLTDDDRAISWLEKEDVMPTLFKTLAVHDTSTRLLLRGISVCANILKRSKQNCLNILGLQRPCAISFLLQFLLPQTVEQRELAHGIAVCFFYLSYEPGVLDKIGKLGMLPLFTSLLLKLDDARTELYLLEILSRTLRAGYVEKLKLTKESIDKLIDIVVNPSSEDSQCLSMHIILQILSSGCKLAVCAYLVDDKSSLDVVIRFSSQVLDVSNTTSNQLFVSSLQILCILVDYQTQVQDYVIAKELDGQFGDMLDDVEQEVNASALHLLSTLLARRHAKQQAMSEEDGNDKSNWIQVWDQLMEWMEVYASEPQTCPIESLADFHKCVYFLTSYPLIATTRLHADTADRLYHIAAESLIFFAPNFEALDKTKLLSKRRKSQALKQIASNDALMIAARYAYLCIPNIIACGTIPMAAEHIPAEFAMMIRDSFTNDNLQVVAASLTCCNHLILASSVNLSTIANLQLIARLHPLLLLHGNVDVVVEAVILLALLSKESICRMNMLQEDRLLTGAIDLIDSHVIVEDNTRQLITANACEMFLSLLDEKEGSVRILEKVGMTQRLIEKLPGCSCSELILKVLCKLSGDQASHHSLYEGTSVLARLVRNQTSLPSKSVYHLVSILRNVMEGLDHAKDSIKKIKLSSELILPNLLPLTRWGLQFNCSVIETVLEIVRRCCHSPIMKMQVNDGESIYHAIELTGCRHLPVAMKAALVLLALIDEPKICATIIVNDGMPRLVQIMKEAIDPSLQCLLLSIHVKMMKDDEVQSIILTNDMLSTLLMYIRESDYRNSVHEERLALSTLVLVLLSRYPQASSLFIANDGLTPLINLHNRGSDNDDTEHESTTLEILSNLSAFKNTAVALNASGVLPIFCSHLTGNSKTNVLKCRLLSMKGLRSLCLSVPPSEWNIINYSEVATTAETLLSDASADLRYAAFQLLGSIATSIKGVIFLMEHCTPFLTSHLIRFHNKFTASVEVSFGHQKVNDDIIELLAAILNGTYAAGKTKDWKLDNLNLIADVLGYHILDESHPSRQTHALQLLRWSFERDYYIQLPFGVLCAIINATVSSAEESNVETSISIISLLFTKALTCPEYVPEIEHAVSTLITVNVRCEPTTTSAAIIPTLTCAARLVLQSGYPSNLDSDCCYNIVEILARFAADGRAMLAQDKAELIDTLCLLLESLLKGTWEDPGFLFDAIQASKAMETIFYRILHIHDSICSNSQSSEGPTNFHAIWTLAIDVLHASSRNASTYLLLLAPLPKWLCLINDIIVKVSSSLLDVSTSMNNAHCRDKVTRDERVLINCCQTLKWLSEGDSDNSSKAGISELHVSVFSNLLILFILPPMYHPRPLQLLLFPLVRCINRHGNLDFIKACEECPQMQAIVHVWSAMFYEEAEEWTPILGMLLQLLVVFVDDKRLAHSFVEANLHIGIKHIQHKSVEFSQPIATILRKIGMSEDVDEQVEIALTKLHAARKSHECEDVAKELSLLVKILLNEAIADNDLLVRVQNDLMTVLAESDSDTGYKKCRSLCLQGLNRLSVVQAEFASDFTHRWEIADLFQIAFADANMDSQEGMYAKSTVLEISSQLYSAVKYEKGVIDQDIVIRALTTCEKLSDNDITLYRSCLKFIDWVTDSKDGLLIVCSQLRYIESIISLFVHTALSDEDLTGKIITKVIAKGEPLKAIVELMLSLLAFIFKSASSLSLKMREQLLANILKALERMGRNKMTDSSKFDRAIRLVASNISSQDEIAQECSWRLLTSLSRWSVAVAAFEKLGCIQSVIEIYLHDPLDKRRHRALKCLSFAAGAHAQTLDKVASTTNMVQQLFSTLCDDTLDGSVHLYAINLFATFASSDMHKSSLVTTEHIASLIEALESVHTKVAFTSLEILYSIREYPKTRDLLIHHATVPVLAQLLLTMDQKEAVVKRSKTTCALGLLVCMCIKNRQVRRRVVSSRLLPTLKNCLMSGTLEDQSYALAIIKCIAEESDLVPKLNEQSIISVIESKLQSLDDVRMIEDALSILQYVISTCPASVWKGDTPIDGLISQVTAIVSQYTRHEEVSLSAVKVLEALTAPQHSEHIAGAFDSKGVVDICIDRLGSANPTLRLACLRIIVYWTSVTSDLILLEQRFEKPRLMLLVEQLSESNGNGQLLSLQVIEKLLKSEGLRSQLVSLAYDMLLRMVQSYPKTTDIETLEKTLGVLSTMTSASDEIIKSMTTSILRAVSSLAPLLDDPTSDKIKMPTLHLLVRYASFLEIRQSMVEGGVLPSVARLLMSSKDDMELHLSLLTLAQLTTCNVSSCLDCLVETIPSIVGLLKSKSLSISANAVWVIANLSNEGRLKEVIIAAEGATALQTVLNDTTSESSSTPSVTTPRRPSSSSQRIREHAPKAIRSLGFDLMPQTK